MLRTSSPMAKSAFPVRSTLERLWSAVSASLPTSATTSSARWLSAPACFAAVVLSCRPSAANSRCDAMSRASLVDEAETDSLEASTPAEACDNTCARMTASSVCRCTASIVSAISSRMRLKDFSRKPSSSLRPAGARTLRAPASACRITARLTRMRSTSEAGIRRNVLATTRKTSASTYTVGASSVKPTGGLAMNAPCVAAAPTYVEAARSASMWPTPRPSSNVYGRIATRNATTIPPGPISTTRAPTISMSSTAEQ